MKFRINVGCTHGWRHPNALESPRRMNAESSLTVLGRGHGWFRFVDVIQSRLIADSYIRTGGQTSWVQVRGLFLHAPLYANYLRIAHCTLKRYFLVRLCVHTEAGDIRIQGR